MNVSKLKDQKRKERIKAKRSYQAHLKDSSIQDKKNAKVFLLVIFLVVAVASVIVVLNFN